MQNLNGLTRLRELEVRGDSVTDAGLKPLYALTELRYQDIQATKVTADGVKKLQQALPNCKITWEPPTPDAR